VVAAAAVVAAVAVAAVMAVAAAVVEAMSVPAEVREQESEVRKVGSQARCRQGRSSEVRW
jgi:cytochrome c-type biogenesis protein CcmH/NrfF